MLYARQGVESEIELACGALHQLGAGLLDRRGALPEPQGDALAIAFGLKLGTPPDRLFVGLAVLGLVSEDGARRMAAAPSKVTGAHDSPLSLCLRAWCGGAMGTLSA